jgi:hypothetical protein
MVTGGVSVLMLAVPVMLRNTLRLALALVNVCEDPLRLRLTLSSPEVLTLMLVLPDKVTPPS